MASDPVQMWGFAFDASNKIKAVLCCVGEDVRGDFAEAAAMGRVDRHFQCLVSRGRSFTPQRGTGLVKYVQNAPPLFGLVREVRDIIRSQLGISLELPVDYRGFKSLPLEDNLIMDAYIIEFSLVSDLGDVASMPQDTSAIPT